RIAIPAVVVLAIGAGQVRDLLSAMPTWLTDGLAIGGGMVVGVGYAMVINIMATRELWPLFGLGLVLATVWPITLIGRGGIG
ncbi:PTS sugar transporter subunit IIC, partial [Heyndrickxia faecalis]|uniref:PTS sugar transporter subunit IIC n=1 Tax=Heyndrickxia faecalis TaxID=2824910 RepID=UPI0032EFFA95